MMQCREVCKKVMLIGFLGWIVATGMSARADLITFDPDGAGGTAPLTNVQTFIYGAGNALADNALPLAPGNTFQLYFQANLASVQLGDNNIVNPTGLNSAYEITIVGSLTEVVLGTTANSATFQLAPVQAANSFIEIWFDSTIDSNPLAGTGFNDGTRILLAAPNPATTNVGGFTIASGAFENFDQAGGVNNYPGILSVSGNGSANVDASVLFRDPAFFLTSLLSLGIDPIGNATPFTLVDPSALFAGLPGGAAPAIVPMIGTVNGAPLALGGGPDFQFQSIAQNGFVVPEPASISLMGLGLLGLLGYQARRARKRNS